jgi:hypothetical protein
MSFPDRLIDKRVVERYLKGGVVNRKDYEKYIEQLPDVVDNSDVVHIDDALSRLSDTDSE